ncbi:hypothetical protein [Leuconostoc pseudomesenteroides]|uniref:hypothetical protein n=1 Tax=Leuconostoc pseudomesenteroides TaxID=33968 RepID=UPI00289680C0|nr:hypothetical protein [Leuconostoc pseudomesenteroides]
MKKLMTFLKRQYHTDKKFALYLMTEQYKGKVDHDHLRYSRLSDAEMIYLRKLDRNKLYQTLRYLNKFVYLIMIILLIVFVGIVTSVLGDTGIVSLLWLFVALGVICLIGILLAIVMGIKLLLVIKNEKKYID